MTELAAAPITAGVALPVRSWRTQDRFLPALSFHVELPVSADTVSGGTVAGGSNLYGTGHNGKRLWLRGANDTWIEIPYGAGQDAGTRSLNIYDAKRKTWMTPAWGWEVFRREAGYGHGPQQIDALNVRAVGRRWVGGLVQDQSTSVYNPTYPSSRTVDQFTARHPGYIRLFYLQKRVDPTWRIVPAGTYDLPPVPPVTTVDLDYNSRFFWPMAGVRTRYVEDNVQQYDSGADGYTITRNTGIFVRQQIFNHVAAELIDPPTVLQVSSTIDLRAIRQQLADTYRERGAFFVGQYDPIELMRVRRVLLQVRPFISTYVYGTAPVKQLIDNMTFRIYANTNTATETGIFTNNQPGWNGETRSIAYPADHRPSGSAIFTKKGSDLRANYSQSPFTTQPNMTEFFGQASYDGNLDGYFDPQYTFEGPGEDNISLYADVENVPTPGGAVDSVFVDLRYYIYAVFIHYAGPGIDTPADTHVLGAIG